MEYSELTQKDLTKPGKAQARSMASRFRGFLPVIVDLETGGFNEDTDALLEVAAVMLTVDEQDHFSIDKIYHRHIEPFEGANIEEAALKVNGIDPFNPLRLARPEKDIITELFAEVKQALDLYECSRAILTGHNAFFDLKFLNAAVRRNKMKRCPFHQFSTLDTVSLGALAYGHTILAKIAQNAGFPWDNESAHSAIYDAYVTAEIFCAVVNEYPARNLDFNEA